MLLNTFAIDGLEILNTNDFVIEAGGVTGLEEPDRRVTTSINPGTDGGFIPSVLYGMRAVSISGAITNKGALGLVGARTALGTVCQLKRTASLASNLRTFTFSLRDGRSFKFLGQVTRYAAPNLGAGLVDFHISIIAPDPLLYDTNSQTSGHIAVASGGGVIIPTLVPFVSAAATGGKASLNNTGNETTYPVIQLVGPLTNPYILNQATGQYMQLTYTVTAGNIVSIDMHENTILLNGAGGLLSAKVQGSKFWGLEPGVNPISFSTGSTSDTGYMILRWDNASISI